MVGPGGPGQVLEDETLEPEESPSLHVAALDSWRTVEQN